GDAAQGGQDDVFGTINRRFDIVALPHGINEPYLEEILARIQAAGRYQETIYWLTLARLTEAALLCAGYYADNCEFRAAGDLLVNPRKVRVQVQGRGPSFIKTRHGRLTDQLMQRFAGNVDKRDAECRIVAPALLPDLYRRLATSGYFTQDYLDHVQHCLTAIASTIAFLAAWQVDANEQLHHRLQSVDSAQKEFIQQHLCRFDATWFWLLGHRIRQAKSQKPSLHGAWTPLADQEEILSLARRN
ncbi:MAG: hypothetical protein HZB24_15285, partial [Desulfobacterales bacterium]|nr:hypothetical protein [Desulfobacterales bacterium]